MRDEKVSGPRVAELHPKIAAEVKQLIELAETKIPAAIRIVQGFRSFEYQDGLYAQGRTKPGQKVTNSKGGQSYHNYGLAIDMALMYDKDGNGTFEELSWDQKKDGDKDGTADWMEVVNIFESAGYTWGGRFHSIPDAPHFEKTFDQNWRTLLSLYRNGAFINGTHFLRL